MPAHPPWLRFQAYVVGLPKTGSTSMSTLFGNYRSGHEWQLMELVGHALARRQGELTDAAFLQATGRRLVPASLEMDSTTSHCLYTDLLIQQFPQALFIHTARDVISWVSSLLDMMLRKRLARQIIQLPYSTWESGYLDLITEGNYDLDPYHRRDDRSSIAPLMRYWAAHMREMAGLLPAGRSLRVRTRDIDNPQQLQEIADFVGIPLSSLRTDLAHTNQAPLRFDRFKAFDSKVLRAVYDKECAGTMAELFPDEHLAWLAYSSGAVGERTEVPDWERYQGAVLEWVVDAVKQYGPGAAH